MDMVEEIEAAMSKLPPQEYRRIFDWLSTREHDRWDEQMDRDSTAGKLDSFSKKPNARVRPGLFANGL